jgi:hypothetical protein
VRHPRHIRRRGSVVVWFALFVWALLGLAALVIDLGLVRVTLREMQTATDAGALEGLRLRDEVPPDLYADPGVAAQLQAAAGPPDPNDPLWRDRARRWFAARLEAWQFNAALDLSTTDTQYGAGPQFNLQGGFPVGDGNFRASQQLSFGQPPLYKPQPQLNSAGNVQSGDLVSGTYNTFGLGIENTDYSRLDFTADAYPPPAGMTPGSAFLARLRRTNNRQGLDNVAGVSSSAGPLPYLFARGSVLAPTLKGDSVTVRGTAIADARPVLSAGPVFTTPTALPGVTPFGLTMTFWNGLDTSQQTGTIDPTGAITVNGVQAGNFTTPPTGLTAVGQRFTNAPPERSCRPGFLPLCPALYPRRLFGCARGRLWPHPGLLGRLDDYIQQMAAAAADRDGSCPGNLDSAGRQERGTVADGAGHNGGRDRAVRPSRWHQRYAACAGFGEPLRV